MKQIFVAGAGKSSSVLIRYLSGQAEQYGFTLLVGDHSLDLATQKCLGLKYVEPIAFDVNDSTHRTDAVSKSDVVISLLPPDMHHLLVEECVLQGKHFVSASYVSAKVSSLEEQAKKQGVMIISECGLDPGIDHMSAMEIIDRLRSEGAEITSFKSYTGGLVAPESNNNPWGYKFSWNPRNVILAGQATACFIADGRYRYIPYSRIFSDIENITVPGFGNFDGYANRDSLSYRGSYGLHDIPTMIRGTLRQRGYCRAWNVFVALGLTDDQVRIHDAGSMTYRQLVESFIPSSIKGDSIEDRVAKFCGLPIDGEAMSMVAWTGIFEDTTIPVDVASPAQILQNLLEQKWRLMPEDRDMIVMVHEFEYMIGESKKRIASTLVVEGDDSVMTAMAKTVGLPLAITALKIIDGSIKLPGGNHIPVSKEIYLPVLKSLASMGIVFKETTS